MAGDVPPGQAPAPRRGGRRPPGLGAEQQGLVAQRLVGRCLPLAERSQGLLGLVPLLGVEMRLHQLHAHVALVVGLPFLGQPFGQLEEQLRGVGPAPFPLHHPGDREGEGNVVRLCHAERIEQAQGFAVPPLGREHEPLDQREEGPVRAGFPLSAEEGVRSFQGGLQFARAVELLRAAGANALSSTGYGAPRGVDRGAVVTRGSAARQGERGLQRADRSEDVAETFSASPIFARSASTSRA